MSDAIENLTAAQRRAMAGRPRVGGFPYLAEVLRRAGVVSYEVDFIARTVTYYGLGEEKYVEAYPAVEALAAIDRGIIS
ncbi:MAG TPA: hypothetical protein VFE47_09160 [Tepidisphaeraceae bacterium]|jgi:uncharacterized protein YbcV (DUF1398 family)|nr:hypothetical protein [Tepidisphaeraceae bacterium]